MNGKQLEASSNNNPPLLLLTTISQTDEQCSNSLPPLSSIPPLPLTSSTSSTQSSSIKLSSTRFLLNAFERTIHDQHSSISTILKKQNNTLVQYYETSL